MQDKSRSKAPPPADDSPKAGPSRAPKANPPSPTPGTSRQAEKTSSSSKSSHESEMDVDDVVSEYCIKVLIVVVIGRYYLFLNAPCTLN